MAGGADPFLPWEGEKKAHRNGLLTVLQRGKTGGVVTCAGMEIGCMLIHYISYTRYSMLDHAHAGNASTEGEGLRIRVDTI